MSRNASPVLNSPSKGWNALRCCCQTKKSADPGRYSHRTTALPRSDCTLKSGFEIANDGAGPLPSGSTVYPVLVDVAASVVGVIVVPSRPYCVYVVVRGLASSLKFP